MGECLLDAGDDQHGHQRGDAQREQRRGERVTQADAPRRPSAGQGEHERRAVDAHRTGQHAAGEAAARPRLPAPARPSPRRRGRGAPEALDRGADQDHDPPTSNCNGSRSTRVTSQRPGDRPRQRGEHDQADRAGRNLTVAPLAEEHEQVDRDREQDHQRHRLDRLEGQEGGGGDEEGESEANRALHGHPEQHGGDEENIGGAHRASIGARSSPPDPRIDIASADRHARVLAAELRRRLVERRRAEAARGAAPSDLEARGRGAGRRGTPRSFRRRGAPRSAS